MGYVTITNQFCLGREGVNSRCRKFDLLLFAVLVHYVVAITAVIAVQVVAVRQVAGDQP